MATATIATGVGAAALFYYTLARKLKPNSSNDDDDQDTVKEVEVHDSPNAELISDRYMRLIEAPATWFETLSTLSETLIFTYSETLGKWPIGELAFGINYHLKKQGKLNVASVFGGKDSLELRGPEITTDLKSFLKLLTRCWYFSKKSFPVFLEETGYSQEDVLLLEPIAEILKPSFTILVDNDTKCLLLLIRGTHSIMDTLTAVTGAVVPFHHIIVHEGRVRDLILGYAHCGMLAAARWIAKLATPCFRKALEKHPDYKIKIVGHSLGGGTAVLLTYALREQQDFSTTTCVTFAPAACMTWELAESGNEFITSVINGADLVPAFSLASVDDLRSEVTASEWLNDLRNQIDQTRLLRTVYRSASALGYQLPIIATVKDAVAGAGEVMRRAQSMAKAVWSYPGLSLSSWLSTGAHDQATYTDSNPQDGRSIESSTRAATAEPFLSSSEVTTTVEMKELPASASGATEWTTEIECSRLDEAFQRTDMNDSKYLTESDRREDQTNVVELREELKPDLNRRKEGKEGDVAAEIRKEEEAVISEIGEASHEITAEKREAHRCFPPGKIMHIVTIPSDGPESEGVSCVNSEDTSNNQQEGAKVRIFLTKRSLYSRLRLSETMISDHFMPAFAEQMLILIRDLEEEAAVHAISKEDVIRSEIL